MIGVWGVSPPVHGVVPLKVNGETLFTHSTWFSEKQYNGWISVPTENKNLALYSSLSTVAFFGIVPITVVRSLGTLPSLKQPSAV